ILACLTWMSAHQLKLIPSKTELLVIPGDSFPGQDLQITLHDSLLFPSATARNLGAAQVLVQSLVISRLDYCNSLLAGLPLKAIRPLQMIQHIAAQVVFNQLKFSHKTPLLRAH
ncbi:hypothetical protein C0J45_23323, partial [Silurus meridionalis]